MKPAPAQAPATEVDVVIRDLKTHPGFAAYLILNQDGIVIKHEGVEYKRAVQFAQLVLDLMAKAKRAVRGVLDAVDNEMESLRLKTREYELLAGQSGSYTLLVVQQGQAPYVPAAAATAAHHLPQSSQSKSRLVDESGEKDAK